MEEPIEEDVEEEDKEIDVGDAPPNGDLALEQAPAPLATLLAVARVWAGGPANQVASQGLGASLRALG